MMLLDRFFLLLYAELGLGSVQYICMNLIFTFLTNVCSLWLQVAAFGEVSSVAYR